MVTIKDLERNDLPLFLTQKQFREQVFHISEIKFLEILHREDSPKVKIGNKFMIPVRKMIEYLENGA